MLIPAVLHVDEIADDQTADVAQSKLTRDFVRRFEVGLQNGSINIASAFVATGVDVDSHQRLGFVDHDVTAAPEPDLSMKGVIDLFLNTVGFEDWRRAFIKMNPIARPARNLAHHLGHAIGCLSIVAHDFVDFFGEKITHRSLNQIGLLKHAVGRGLIANELLNLRPLVEQEPQIAHKISRPLAFANRADDYTNSIGNIKVAQNLAEPVALFRVLDFARNAAAIAERHQHEVAPGKT